LTGKPVFSRTVVWVLLALAASPSVVAEVKGSDVLQTLKQEKSILDALDHMVFEERQAQREIEAAEAARKQAETRLALAEKSLAELLSAERTARDRLRVTLRLIAATRPMGGVMSIFLGLGDDDESRRRVMLVKLTTRQAGELARLDKAARKANTARFIASMERANGYAAAAAGRQAKARLQADTIARRKMLAALESDRSLHMRHEHELDAARKAMVRLVEARLSKAPGAVHFERLKARLRWPLAGSRVLVPFGNRVHPEFKTVTPHPGLTLVYDRGNDRNVRAVAFGKVVYSGSMRGYGTTVILDHASGYYTVYAGLSTLRVKEGQIVREGDILGLVERGPGDTDLRLYFELRKGHKALDPLPYLQTRTLER